MLIDTVGWVANIIGISSFIPQCYKVYQTNNTKSLSLNMYILITISFSLWIIYGFFIESMPIIGGNIIMFCLSTYILTKKINNFKRDNAKL